MRQDTICPNCRQPIRYARVGVQLSNIKARLFDMLHAAGDIGVSLDEMRNTLVVEGKSHCTPHSVKSHISQMRDVLADAGWAITCDRHRPPRWFLVQRSQGKAA